MNNIQQSNTSGHNIGGDYIAGNKVEVESIIIEASKEKAVIINVSQQIPDTLLDEDKKEFRGYILNERILEYKNLLNQTHFNCELLKYSEALNFIKEANKICHNHHIVLSYHALCIYATSKVNDLLTKDELTTLIIHLLKKAKELNPNSEYYNRIAPLIGDNFYSIINEYIVKIQDDAPKYFRIDRQKLYYSAVAKSFIHFESCFEIWEDTKYLKEYVLHLSGYRRYAWINIEKNNKIEDLGSGIFKDGALGKLKDLINQIKQIEPNYIPPLLKYGYYFELVQPTLSDSERLSKKRLYASWILVILALICSTYPLFVGNIREVLIFYTLFILTASIFSPCGKHNLNILQKITIWILNKIK